MRWIRRAIVFALGIIILVDSLQNRFHLVEFIVALIMIGLIPVDTIIDVVMPKNDEETIKRLREVYKPDDKE